MNKKWILIVFASIISTLVMRWGYQIWHSKADKNNTLATYFQYKELPNQIIAQHGDYQLHGTDLIDVDLKKLETQLEDLKNNKSGLLDLNIASSKIFRKKLDFIKKKISDFLILQNAKQTNSTIQQYTDAILNGKELALTKEEFTKELQQLGLTEKDPAAEKIKKLATNKKRQKLIDEEINKIFLKTPILTSLTPPSFEIPLPKEWTPHWGADTAIYKLVVFTDFKTQSSQILNKSLLNLSQKRSDLQIYWRPYFLNAQDYAQNLIAQASLCLWQQKQNAFFYVLYTLEYIHHDTAEADLYRLAGQNNFNVEDLKKCLVQQKYKEVIDYHVKYGDYLKINTLPLLFINGEALSSEFREDVIEQHLQTYKK